MSNCTAVQDQTGAKLWDCGLNDLWSCSADCNSSFTVDAQLDLSTGQKSSLAFEGAIMTATTTITVTMTSTSTPSATARRDNHSTFDNTDGNSSCTETSTTIVSASVGVPLGCAFLIVAALFIRERRKKGGAYPQPFSQPHGCGNAPQTPRPEDRLSGVTNISGWVSRLISRIIMSDGDGSHPGEGDCSTPVQPVELHASESKRT